MNKKNIFVLIILIVLVALSIFAYYFYFRSNDLKSNSDVADLSLQNIKNKEKLIVGTDAPYGVMEYFDKDGKIVGLDIDIINEVAKRMGVQVELRDIDWDNLFDAVKTGKVDVAISGIAITEERKKEILFSVPYHSSGQVIIVRKENTDIKVPTDLANKIVGSQIESVCIAEAAKYVKPENLKSYGSFDESTDKGIFYDLGIGKLDAVVIGYEAGIGVVRNNRNLRMASAPFAEDFSGIASKIGNDSLINEINIILRDMKREGVINSLTKKWLYLE